MTGFSGASFSYEGSGNRLQAVRNGVTTRYIYDMRGNLLAEADGNNNITRYYIYGKGLLAMVTPAGQVYCYHYNAVGSTIALTDQNQAMVNKYAYDPFGNVGNQVEAIQQPFKYVGQYGVMTEPNGFYYMKARYYDPQVGRFISEDPIGFDGGDVNLSTYVGNNPVNKIDPLGLDQVEFVIDPVNGAIVTIGTPETITLEQIINQELTLEITMKVGLFFADEALSYIIEKASIRFMFIKDAVGKGMELILPNQTEAYSK